MIPNIKNGNKIIPFGLDFQVFLILLEDCQPFAFHVLGVKIKMLEKKFSFDPRDNNHKTRDYDSSMILSRGLRLNSRGFG